MKEERIKTGHKKPVMMNLTGLLNSKVFIIVFIYELQNKIMALIEWKKSYDLGILHLDTQHKGLVKQINTLHDAMKLGKGTESLNEILNALIDYTATHFKSEEKLFHQFNFPDSEKHIAEHSKFVEEVLSFKQGFESGQLMVSIEVMGFLKGWLINHILGSDMGYKSFLLLKGVR